MEKASPDPEAIEAALGRILAWPDMARSPQLAQFLDYIVHRTLAGDAQSIKAYSIAVDVFGRSESFDPQADPIVRVQARRLRKALEHYYGSAGEREQVHIELPVGRYVPEFRLVHGAKLSGAGGSDSPPPGVHYRLAHDIEAALPRGTRGHVTLSWFVIVVAVAGVAALVYALATLGARLQGVDEGADLAGQPTLAVLDFQNLTGQPSSARLSAGLALELVTDLDRFGTISVRYGGAANQGQTIAGVDYVLGGIVRRAGKWVQYSAILTETDTSDVVWTRAVTLDEAQVASPGAVDRVSNMFSRALGSARGPLHARTRSLIESGESLAGNENLYLCHMLFDYYRDNGSALAAARAGSCYQTLGNLTVQNGPALAAMASLQIEAPSAMGDERGPPDDIGTAGELVERALQLSPTSSFVWEQKARLADAMGQTDIAEQAYGSSLQLNPASLDAMAAWARHLAFAGHLADAEPIANAAIAGAPSAPPWYMGVAAIGALSRNEYPVAVTYSEIYARADKEIGPILVVMAAQNLADNDKVSRYLARIFDIRSFHQRGIMPTVRLRIPDGQLLLAIRQSLIRAGVPQTALDGPF